MAVGMMTRLYLCASLFFQPHPLNEDAIIIPENEYCKSHKMTVFVGCIYAYKGLLMVSTICRGL